MRLFTAFATLALASPLLAAQPAPQPLPTGQQITPTAVPGSRFDPLVVRTGPNPAYVADGAAAAARSPDGRELLVLTSGFNRYNGRDGKIVPEQSVQYIFRYRIGAAGATRLQTLTVPNSYSGIAWRPDGSGFIVGGGVDDVVYLFAKRGSRFVPSGKVALGHKSGNGADVRPQAAGVAVSPDGRRALVANYYNDSVSLIDLAHRTVIAERDLRPGKIDPARAGVPGGENPFALAWTDARHAFVSAPRDRELVALEIGARSITVTSRIPTIGQPTALMVAKGRLFATEDNADRLAIVDPKSATLLAEPRLALPAALGAPPLGKGLNPNSLDMLPDGRLLVTLGGINALALVVPAEAGAEVQALLPTGWYPSAVGASRDGKRIFVANRKSPPGPNPEGCPSEVAQYRGQSDACGASNQYVWQLEKAGLLQFPMPSDTALAAATLQVARNLGLPDAPLRAKAEARLAAIRPLIRHVVFIIKENRTYDEVLGDLDIGNGDPRLAILGKPFSPNHHRLARQFVTLDNFYDSGEVSSTGWSWSTSARATDLLEKNVPVNYAGRGLAYEAEEANRNIYTQQSPEQRRATNPGLPADPDLLPGPALIAAADPEDDELHDQGFLWNAAIRAGLTVRNYGFADASIYDPGSKYDVPPIREPSKEGRRVYSPGDALLATRSNPYFRGFDMRLADYWRVLEWQKDYDAADAAGTLPALTLLRLSHDHFGSFDTALDGVNTVETQMADNDYSLGLVVERIARSRAAGSTLVFVIEDDAQNGRDHVDARRSMAFVVGPYVRQGALVSTRYTTVNVLRTIEAVLGLKPMNLNDALAMPMGDLFDPAQSSWTYRAEASDVLRTTQLPIPADRFAAPAGERAEACPGRSSAWWAQAMRGQDFRTEDVLDTAAFNAALWRGLGTGPAPVTRDGADLRANRAQLLARVKLGCPN